MCIKPEFKAVNPNPRAQTQPYPRGVHLYNEVKSCRPVSFTGSKTQPYHESSSSPWQQRPPSLSRGRRPL